MAIIKKNLTKHVWVDGEKWKVEQVFSPTKYDDYLLLSRVCTEEIHEDGKTEPVELSRIDCHNWEFYPDTAEIRKIMQRRENEKKTMESTWSAENGTLDKVWLQMFPGMGNY